MFMFSSVAAIALTTTLAATTVMTPSTPVKSTSAPSTLATLRAVNATPMASAELRAVKGADAHFSTSKSQNELFGITGFHVVNRNNRDNWVDLGNGILVGPGYHGLCGAALKAPNMLIPGQNPTTGVGGGC